MQSHESFQFNYDQLAKKLSGTGIRVSYIDGELYVVKTISMSAKYGNIKCNLILDDTISMIYHHTCNINKKKFVEFFVNHNIADKRISQKLYRNGIKGRNSGSDTNGLGERFERIHKTYYFLRKSTEVTPSIYNLFTQYFDCKLSDLKTQKEIYDKIKDEIKVIANDLHLSLTLEKDAMDTHYLLPLLRQEKMDKAIKGIYKTEANKFEENPS